VYEPFNQFPYFAAHWALLQIKNLIVAVNAIFFIVIYPFLASAAAIVIVQRAQNLQVTFLELMQPLIICPSLHCSQHDFNSAGGRTRRMEDEEVLLLSAY
jgi:hypothetical protein